MRWLRRLVAILVGALTALAGVLVLVVLALDSAGGRSFARSRLEAMLSGLAPGLHVEIGRLRATDARTLVLEDVVVRAGRERLVRAARASVTLSLRALLDGRLHLAQVVVGGLDVRLVRDAAGWRLPSPAGGAAPAAPFAVDDLRVDGGRIAIALRDRPSRRLAGATRVRLAAAVATDRDGCTVRVSELGFVPRGLSLGAVTARGTVRGHADGSIEVTDVEIASPRSRLRADGRLGGAGHALALEVDVLPLAAADVRAILPSAPLRADVWSSVTLGGTAVRPRARAIADFGAAGRLRVDLRAWGAEPDLRWVTRLVARRLDPGAVVSDLPHARLRGALRLHGQGRDPQAYRLALGRSLVEDHRIDRAVVVGAGARGRHHLRALIAAPAGSGRGRAAIRLTRVPSYRLDARVGVTRLASIAPELPGWLRTRVSMRGEGVTAAARRIALRGSVTGGEIRGLGLAAGQVRARLAGPILEVTELGVQGPLLRVEAAGTADLEQRRLAASVGGSVALATIATGAPGTVAVTARLSGTPESLMADATAEIVAARIGALTVPRAAIEIGATGLGGPEPAARATATATGAHVADGPPLDASARVTLGRDRKGIEAVLEALTVTAPGATPWTLARPVRARLDDGIDLGELVLGSGGQRVTMGGRFPVSGATSGRLDLAKVDLAPLCAVLAGPPCAGRVAGSASVTGTAESPRLAADLVVSELPMPGPHHGQLRVRATYSGCLAEVEGTLEGVPAAELSLRAAVPVALAWRGRACDRGTVTLDVTVRAVHVDLSFLRALAPDRLRVVEGVLSADLRVRGSPDAPVVSGAIAVDDGRVDIAGTGVPYDRIRARLIASAAGLEVAELTARGGTGSAVGSGRLRWAGPWPDLLDLQVQLTDFLAVRVPACDAALSGGLAVEGSLAAPVVRGSLDVVRAVLRPGGGGRSTAEIAPDPTIEVVGAPPGPASEPTAPTAADRLALTIQLHLRDDVWVRRPDADIQLGGDLRLDKATHDALRVSGLIRILRGTYIFQSRRFDIDQGAITLAGDVPPRAALDVTATYRANEYLITVLLSGSSDKPTLTLTSDPPLDQAEILAVLLFGRPAATLGQETSVLQQQAIQIAADYATPDLTRSVREVFGLDTMSVSFPEGDTAPGRVAVGRYVTQDVFVSLAQEFGPRIGQTLGLEYRVRRNLSLRLSTSTRGASAVDLLWNHRY